MSFAFFSSRRVNLRKTPSRSDLIPRRSAICIRSRPVSGLHSRHGLHINPCYGMASDMTSTPLAIHDIQVKRCPRARPHDWTQCPFAHPGEKMQCTINRSVKSIERGGKHPTIQGRKPSGEIPRFISTPAPPARNIAGCVSSGSISLSGHPPPFRVALGLKSSRS